MRASWWSVWGQVEVGNREGRTNPFIISIIKIGGKWENSAITKFCRNMLLCDLQRHIHKALTLRLKTIEYTVLVNSSRLQRSHSTTSALFSGALPFSSQHSPLFAIGILKTGVLFWFSLRRLPPLRWRFRSRSYTCSRRARTLIQSQLYQSRAA